MLLLQAELTAPPHYNCRIRARTRSFKDFADAGSGETGRLWELEQLLRQLWRGRERSAPETLRWMEDFGAEQFRELQLNLGPWAEIFWDMEVGTGVSRTQSLGNFMEF